MNVKAAGGRVEVPQGMDVGALGGVAGDVREADRRVVLARVRAVPAGPVGLGRALLAGEAAGRDALLVGAPGLAGRGQLAEEAVTGEVVGAVAGHAQR